MLESLGNLAVVVIILLVLTWLINLIFRFIKDSLVPNWITVEMLSKTKKLLLATMYILAGGFFVLNLPPVKEYINRVGVVLPERFFSIIITLVVTLILAFSINRIFQHRIKKLGDNAAKTTYRMMSQLSVILIVFIGIMATLHVAQIGGALIALLTSAGFLGIVLGLAAQATLSNIFSGISIALSKPYMLRDAILYHDNFGFIEDIKLRHTVIRTWDNRRIIVPNAQMDREAVINYSIEDPEMTAVVFVDVTYESNLDKAFSILQEEARKHPLSLPEKMEPKVHVTRFKDSGIELRLIARTRSQSDAFQFGCDLRKNIAERFRAEPDIEIPYPRRYLTFGQPEKEMLKEMLNEIFRGDGKENGKEEG
jgi:small-conductance mechanosensitive channel